MCYQLFSKKVHYSPPKHASQMNSHNIIGRNPLIVIPLLVNQDLAPFLAVIRLLAKHTVADI